METAIGFIALMASLLGVPALAPFIAADISKKPLRVKKRAYIVAFLFAISVYGLMKLSVTFSSFTANAVVLFLAYASFGFLAFSLFWIKPKVIGITLGVLACIPLAIGMLLSTLGILGLMFIAGDFKIAYESKVPSGSKCIVSNSGNAVTPGGKDVRLYKQIIWGVEYQTARKYYADNSKSQLYPSDQEACESLDSERKQ